MCVCSCVFVWRLDSQMTSTMRRRRSLRLPVVPGGGGLRHQIRRETFITAPSLPPQMREEEEEEEEAGTPARLGVAEGEGLVMVLLSRVATRGRCFHRPNGRSLETPPTCVPGPP